jgi:hypothetical protein
MQSFLSTEEVPVGGFFYLSACVGTRAYDNAISQSTPTSLRYEVVVPFTFTFTMNGRVMKCTNSRSANNKDVVRYERVDGLFLQRVPI